MEKYIAKTKYGEVESEKEFKFSISENGVLVWGSWYVDTLMESAEDYLKYNTHLYLDAGAQYLITNMAEFIRFILKNRLDIERDLRKSPEEIPLGSN